MPLGISGFNPIFLIPFAIFNPSLLSSPPCPPQLTIKRSQIPIFCRFSQAQYNHRIFTYEAGYVERKKYGEGGNEMHWIDSGSALRIRLNNGIALARSNRRHPRFPGTIGRIEGVPRDTRHAIITCKLKPRHVKIPSRSRVQRPRCSCSE